MSRFYVSSPKGQSEQRVKYVGLFDISARQAPTSSNAAGRFLKEAVRWADPLQKLDVADYVLDIAKDVLARGDDDISMEMAERYLMYGVLLQNYSRHSIGEK